MGRYFIAPEQLWAAIAGSDRPRIVDVRRREVFQDDHRVIPGAVWRNHLDVVREEEGQFLPGDDVVLYCVHGHNVSQLATAALRARGVQARTLRGGIDGWREAGLPVRDRRGLPMLPDGGGSRWITRRRPKIDRIACPWLIRRFIDPDASFLFVEPDQVLAVAEELAGIAFDLDGAPITHDGELCSFDVLLDRSGIQDPALADLATIIRGADTARPDLAPEAAGLLALSIGISALAGEDDHLALERGMALYDALYAWRRKAPNETHNWPGGRL